MSPFPLSFDRVLESCAAEPGRVRPIGEVLTTLLAKYQIAVEPAGVQSRAWNAAAATAHLELAGAGLLVD